MMNKSELNRRSRFSGQFSESRLNAILGAAMRGTIAACLLTGAAVIVGAGFHTGAWLAEKAGVSAGTEHMLQEASEEYARQADCIDTIAESASQHGTSLDATCQQAKAAMKYWADQEASMEASMEASEAGTEN